MAHLPAMDTIATLKSLSPKRRKRKDAQVIVDAPPQELRVGDVVFLGDGTDGYLASDALGARVSFKRGEGGGVPTYKLGCLWQLFPDSDYRRRERLVRLGSAFELRKTLKRQAVDEKLQADAVVKDVESGSLKDTAVYGEEFHIRHVVTGRWLRGDGEPAESGGGFLRLSLATDLERSKYCRFRIAPGYRARGLGTPVFDGDGVRLEAQALTLSPNHPARLQPTSDNEAALALGSTHNLTVTRFAERAPGQAATGTVDALQFVRLFHREDDTLLVASTNARLKTGPKREPYLRHISRRKESPGKGLWILEFEDPLTGGAFSFERKVRLRHACSDRHLAVAYGERGTKGPAAPELVDLKQDAKKGALVRSLFRLKPVRDHEASSGFACLITHDVRPKNRDGDRTTLYLKASEPKKDRSRRIVFEDNSNVTLGASLGATVEVHIEIGPEALTLQALKAARTAVEEHTEFVRRVGRNEENVDDCAARAKILRAENALRGALSCLRTSNDNDLEAFANAQTEEQHKDDDNDGVDDDVELSFEHTGPVDAAAQSMTREVKLIDALARAIACVKTSGIKYPPAPGEQHDPRFGPLEEFHQLAYAVLVTSVRDNRRNETYFAKGRLVAEAGKPEEGAFIDQVIAEVRSRRPIV